jgi:2-polyprenyl-3-methyl-5-hydroxy-6-metoxy-1,4-benzoquinol methylase
MSDNRLKIISADSTFDPLIKKQGSRRKDAQQEALAKLERMWMTDPDQFNPLRKCMGKERLERTKKAIQTIQCLPSSLAVDLGCGFGLLSYHLRDLGWKVHAVDAASQALKRVNEGDVQNIELIQDRLPNTKLDDDHYDLVLSTDVIGYLAPEDYRLYVSELSRLVKPQGFVICSTAIDIDSEDALQKFGSLAETEFLINQWIFSHHLLYIRLKNFFETPSQYVKASQDNEYRFNELKKRESISKWWFRVNSTRLGGIFWKLPSFLAQPFVYLLTINHSLLLTLEKLCRFIWSDSGISHAIFIGQRRPLDTSAKEESQVIIRKGKKQVWE